jgi:hypothetical protein
MREYLFDAALIIFGVAATLASGWLLTHLSDRSVLRWMRPRTFFVPRPLRHDETVAQRSLTVAFAGIFFLIVGTVCLMSGVLRLFGFGR